MDRRLGLSNHAVYRIGRRLVAQAAPVDPSEGTFLSPFSSGGGVAGADTADLDMRVTQLENAVQALQEGLGALQKAPPQGTPVQEAPKTRKRRDPMQSWDPKDPFNDAPYYYGAPLPFG